MNFPYCMIHTTSAIRISLARRRKRKGKQKIPNHSIRGWGTDSHLCFPGGHGPDHDRNVVHDTHGKILSPIMPAGVQVARNFDQADELAAVSFAVVIPGGFGKFAHVIE
jgi:hypothetical protein